MFVFLGAQIFYDGFADVVLEFVAAGLSEEVITF